MQASRRQFLLGAAAAGAITTPSLAARAAADPQPPAGGPGAAVGSQDSVAGGQDAAGGARAIGRKRIPATGELLPMIGLGTSRTFNVDPSKEQAAQLEVMRRFLDLGGSLIDSSPMYGQAEALCGKLLQQLERKDLFYATKVWTDKGREAGIAQMKESQRLMGPERFDLMQVHNLTGLKEQLATLKAWKVEGRIRYLGVTEMRDYATVEKLMKEDGLDFIQIPYSLGSRKVEERILPTALDNGVAVLVMRPFEAGRLFKAFEGREIPQWAQEFGCHSWAQFMLKFLLGHPAVTCPIPATSKPHHLSDNMAAGVGRLPNADERQRMVALLES